MANQAPLFSAVREMVRGTLTEEPDSSSQSKFSGNISQYMISKSRKRPVAFCASLSFNDGFRLILQAAQLVPALILSCFCGIRIFLAL